MRIVAGDLRGRPIRTPAGVDTRPTSDRAREGIFNILQHAPWSPGLEGKRVIDLFAGSGATGLEALSRGAAECLFVETAGAAMEAIRANIEAFRLGSRARVLRTDATRLPKASQAFDIAFLDPPYGKGLGEAALASLAPGVVAVLELGADEPAPAGHEVLDERRYGKARIWFLLIR